MSDELFVDGISGIGFGKGAVRIDFFALSADSLDGKGKPAKERKQRLVMTTEGFIESFAMLAGVMEKLKTAGLVAKRPAADGGKTQKPPQENDPGSPSPNF
ncbi:conserved hypothetical protein [Solidesulfovibrio fructosivorans JJ]]|uniref:Uncharacterized protein n=1 Tax=Solidesulfovibrio fructosivorans JJ] TaxID=596151 RepID=E1JVF9_SOLFR|nr:hypothetical protein [Solidesulfovibrio fructosivorans]EFL51753.1 conserved hypothetical protein [Solidesulfovibrio fructosivorans JJ]]